MELDKEQDRVARGVKENKAVAEVFRSKMVGAMRIGKPLVIVCGDEFPDFKDKFKLDE